VPADIIPLTRIPALDTILELHASELGKDFAAYRHHAFRVANLCLSQTSRSPDTIAKVAVAAGFHDLGIWTHRTFDYLGPSVTLAAAYLSRVGRAEWIPEITETICAHHQVSRYQGRDGWVVEPFRRADWMDVSMGAITFGLSRRLLEATLAMWPRAGLHKRLVQLGFRRLLTHPWSPLPMVRL
jgi:hypothetical protein